MPRLEGGWLLAARGVWLSTAFGSIGLVTVGFLRAFADPQQIALLPLTELFSTLGLSFRLMITIALLLPFMTVVGICGVVFWRRSSDPMALLFTLTLLLTYAFASRTLLTYAGHPILQHAVSVVFGIAMMCLALILCLFPDGRWTPRWSRSLPLLAAALVIAIPDGGRLLTGLLDGDVPVTGAVATLVVGWSAVFVLGMLAQVHRYRHVSGAIERQQAKWVVLPLASLLTLFVLILVLPIATSGRGHRWVGILLFLAVPLGIALPLAVANAVLRYRLYDTDRVLSRTVSYALLTTVLAGVYVAGIVIGGALLRRLADDAGGDLVVAATTLTVAGLFQPLRRRIQTLVDRRFNRSGYDAARTVEDFAQRLRDQVELDMLTEELRVVVRSVVQPHDVSVWLAGRATTGDRP